MKYIRTKNGKIHTLHNYQGWDNFYTCTNGWKDLNNMCYKVRKMSVVKQADTIKELCDEFVYVDEEIKQFLVSDDLDMYKAKQLKVFGAIWTDKGLIYVAKMNEKGELELL